MEMLKRRCSCVFALVVGFGLSVTVSNASTLVTTRYGSVQGQSNSLAKEWLGLPFAKPPVGDLRWEAPRDADNWYPAILKATAPPNACPQTCTPSYNSVCPKVLDEDCLYLNVYAPLSSTANSALPILLYIHGGSYDSGYSTDPYFNGSWLVDLSDGQLMVVTINYRLGVLGSFYDKYTQRMGNYGYFDQLKAIEWVFHNIDAFGGDPQRITLFGQSAGAASVGTHLVNTSSKIVKGAILQSNPWSVPLRSTETWGNIPKSFKTWAGCHLPVSGEKQLECLRKLSVADTIKAQKKTQVDLFSLVPNFMNLVMCWSPTVGTGVINEQLMFSFQKGNVLDVPIVIGSVRAEADLFVYGGFKQSLDYVTYTNVLRLTIGKENADKVNDYYATLYPGSDYRMRLSAICTDGMFVCGGRNVTHALTERFEAGMAKAKGRAVASDRASANWLYHFNHVDSFNSILFPDSQKCWDSVCHKADYPFTFNADIAAIYDGQYSMSGAEKKLAELTAGYWAEFGLFGTPKNGAIGAAKGGVQWTRFASQTQDTMLLDTAEPSNDYRGAYVDDSRVDLPLCDFWDSLQYSWL